MVQHPAGKVDLHWLTRWVDVPSFFRFAAVRPAHGIVVARDESIHRRLSFVEWLRAVHDRMPSLPKAPLFLEVGCVSPYFQAKKRAYQNHRLHVVGNSEWTTSQARRAALFRDAISF